MPKNFIAIDLGAGSGRAITAKLDGGKLALDVTHRFANNPVRVNGHLHWDVLRLFEEILRGLALSAKQHGEIASVGVDTWGVDFGVLDKTDTLIGNPYHYRDHRTDGMMESVFAQVPAQDVYDATGNQFMFFNTLFQLAAMRSTPALEQARALLMMPDLFHFWLCGQKSCEATIASTTQCFNPRQNAWADGMLNRLGIPSAILQPIAAPATRLGKLLAAHTGVMGLERAQVVAPAAHDTGSAVAAVPARSKRFVFISSGTWSLMGAVAKQPVITPQTFAFGFTNEGGVDGTTRLLKNITGMWLIQECRRVWASAGEELSYDALVSMAQAAPAFLAFIDPNDASFNAPDDMPAAIQAFCAASGQAIPKSKGEILRVAFESLALKYREVLDELQIVMGQPLDVIHIVGGGSQNRLLCQFTANACNRPVLAGPVEATAIGNALAQAIAAGECAGWAEAREIVRATFSPIEYAPRETEKWDEAFERFVKTRNKK